MSLEDKLNEIYLGVRETLQQKDLDMYNVEETKTKCYYCDQNYEKNKLVWDLIELCKRDQSHENDYFKFQHLYSNFNDPFLIRNIGLYTDAVNRNSKEYCKKYNEEFKIYINKLKELGIFNTYRRRNF